MEKDTSDSILKYSDPESKKKDKKARMINIIKGENNKSNINGNFFFFIINNIY